MKTEGKRLCYQGAKLLAWASG